MRIVLDTNVYIGAALQGELTEDILEELVENPQFELIASEEIFLELEQKLREKFHWSKERIEFFLRKIRKIAEIVEPTERVNVITRDPEDNKILECAISGDADLIVTLDQDLIKLKKYQGIGIIHPKTLSWTFPEYFKKDN
ncbi:putative toxin-antitoxin system toxin component, PIN family [Candidatus Daviesbacteria bacterium]|nr:putative toxin-antitoxin system toxin component, PIN family [Candidatus Daviesbacteria bacterium]